MRFLINADGVIAAWISNCDRKVLLSVLYGEGRVAEEAWGEVASLALGQWIGLELVDDCDCDLLVKGKPHAFCIVSWTRI